MPSIPRALLTRSVMDPDRILVHPVCCRSIGAVALGLSLCMPPLDVAAAVLGGRVLDTNGGPLPRTMVTLDRQDGSPIVSVFTDAQGKFVLPGSIERGAAPPPVTVRLLGYRQTQLTELNADQRSESVDLVILMQRQANQAGVAPASAWLGAMENHADSAKLVQNCVACHQLPAPEVRDYARAIHDLSSPDTAVAARHEGWSAMVKYMNFLSAEEFGRGDPNAPPLDAGRAYSVGDTDAVTALLAKHLAGPMDRIEGYEYGAPLAVNAATVIREYRVDEPNTVREALLVGKPARLWAADVNSNNVIEIDPATGRQKVHTVPSEVPVGPHTLVRGGDGSLWVAPFFNAVVAKLDPVYDDWKVWNVRAPSVPAIGIHDLSFGFQQELATDQNGRVWYSDISNNAVGYFDPRTGAAEIFRVPEIAGRPGSGASLYGLVMTADRKHVWYSQLGIASFGCFNTETLKFETAVTLPDIDAGPRRLAISDEDILYVPLYGNGQLIEYDARNRRQLGIYDLPDRAAAPYSVTWDPVRRVVWIPTANANLIYRFDPRDKSFSVIPLPREQAFLRMVGIEPESGLLVSAYGNIVASVHGPRMVVVIDPGDDYQALKQSPTNTAARRN